MKNITGTEYIYFRIPKNLKAKIERLAKERAESIDEYITRSMKLITQFKD